MPYINIESLAKQRAATFSPDPSVIIVSVDVMVVSGNTASPVSRDAHIFYDSEILAIVYRTKSRSTGLASTIVWGWQGKGSQVGDREERKLQDLAKRYGTKLVSTSQMNFWKIGRSSNRNTGYDPADI